MPTPDGRIGSRDICTGAAVERVIADGGVTSLKISATLQSDNFSSGSAGWQINRATGSAEFQDVVVRGTLNASDITTGTLNTSVLASGSIGMGKIEVQAALVTNQYLQSTSYSAGSSGWRINADGTAEFQDVTVRGSLNADDIDAGALSADYLGAGTIGVHALYLSNSSSSFLASNDGSTWYIRGDGTAKFADVEITGTVNADAGYLDDMNITGTLQMGSSGTIVSDTSGVRYELGSNTYSGYIYFYWGSESSPGHLRITDGGGSSPSMWLSTPTGTGVPLFINGNDSVKVDASDRLTLEGDEVYVQATGGVVYIKSASTSDSVYLVGGASVLGEFYYSGGNSYMETEVVVAAVVEVSNEVQVADGAVGDPPYTFSNSGTSGYYHIGSGYTAISSNGYIMMQWGRSGGGAKNIYLYGLPSTTTNFVRYNGGTGELGYSSSTLRIKKNIRDLPVGLTDLLRPSLFDYRRDEEIEAEGFRVGEDDWDTTHAGHIAEWTAEIAEWLGVYNQGDPIPVNYDIEGILAVLVKDLQDTRQRLAKVEEAA